MPLVIRWPRATRPGRVCDVPVTGTDFYPTLLEMAGLESRPDQHRDGVSLVPLLGESGGIERDALYWHYPHYAGFGAAPSAAVRSGGYKLIELFESPDRVELYDLERDPGELRDLAARDRRRTAAMRAMLRDWRRSVGAAMPARNPDWKPPL